METLIWTLIIIVVIAILGLVIYPIFIQVNNKNYNASNLIMEIKGNTAFCLHGDIVVCHKIEYPPQYSLSQEHLDSIHVMWQQALESLPDGTIVLKSDIYDNKLFNSENMPAEEYIQKDCKEYYAKLKHLTHQGYIFFVFTKYSNFKDSGLANPFLATATSKLDENDTDFNRFSNGVELACSIINNSRIVTVAPMNKQEIIDYSDYYFNGFQSAYKTDLYANKNSIYIDGKYISAVSIENEECFPEHISNVCDSSLFSVDNAKHFYQGYLDCLGLLLDTSHMYNQIIIMDSHQKHISTIETQCELFQKERGWSPANGQGAIELKGYLDEIAKDSNYHYIRGNTNLIFWCDSEHKLKTTQEKILGALKIKNFKPALPTGEELKNIFYCSHCATVSCMRPSTLYLIDLRQALCLFMNTSTYKDDDEGIYLCERMFNTPVKYDLWDRTKKYVQSRNVVVKAGTGSGKSVVLQHIVRQYVEEGIITLVLDIGNSYSKTARLFPKDWVINYSYKPGQPLGLNPFFLEIGEVPDSDKIESICKILWTLVRKDGEVNDAEKTSLRAIVAAYYESGDDYSWLGFYDWLKMNHKIIFSQCDLTPDVFNVNEFLHGGSDYVTGIYANLFAPAEDVSKSFKDKRLIIFELDNIKDNPVILNVILHIVDIVTKKLIWSDKSKRGFILYEEFAQQLKNPIIFNTVLFQAQAIRKQNGAIGIVLQNLYQLNSNANDKSKSNGNSGMELLSNFETIIFCADKNYQDYDKLQPLSELDKLQIESLQNSFNTNPAYSEFYIKRTRGSSVCRLSIGRNTWLAYQTEGKECDALEIIYGYVMSMEKAIDIYNKIEPFYTQKSVKSISSAEAIFASIAMYNATIDSKNEIILNIPK